MAEDQSWKERGTGTLRVNIPKKSSDKRLARLVMRADGILRVILNVPLFQGMKCELHEKFVRIVALEDTKPVHYAIKLSNPNNAAALMDVLDDFVISEDSSAQA
uniref:RanBD1 domain-containing protein n=2 Tax=Kalmanozyma brasiliensis (strain GHG001) TaxID=1365824 RepID=V5GEW2_KALBG